MGSLIRVKMVRRYKNFLVVIFLMLFSFIKVYSQIFELIEPDEGGRNMSEP